MISSEGTLHGGAWDSEHKSYVMDMTKVPSKPHVPSGIAVATAVETVTLNSRFVIDVHDVLVDVRSQFQHIFIYTNPYYGKVMMLDSVIQCTLR